MGDDHGGFPILGAYEHGWGIAGLLILALTALGGTAIFTITIDQFTGKTGETPLGGREALWQGAWLLIRDHTWGGVGIGNASRAVVQLPPQVCGESSRGIAAQSRANNLGRNWDSGGYALPGCASE